MARTGGGANPGIDEQLTRQVAGGELTIDELNTQLARAKAAGFDGAAVIRVSTGQTVGGMSTVQKLHFVTFEKPQDEGRSY
jgi:hypothetical protein